MRLETAERMELLASSENALQTTYDSLSMPLIEVGADGRISNVNAAVCIYLGAGRNNIIGRALESALPFDRDDDAAFSIVRQHIQLTLTDEQNTKSEVESGGKIFKVFTFPLRSSSEASGKALVMLNDVTETRAIYRRIVQDNKMAAVGQLAAGVAHEIRNPLGLIRNYCYVLRKSPADDADTHSKALSMMEDAVERSSKIIDNLLRFSRLTDEVWADVDIRQAINSILSLEELSLRKKNIQVILNCENSIRVNTILESFEMILINLIKNAEDAVSEGGRITIDCVVDGGFFTTRVTDTGQGIPDSIRSDIFNPFFTTKEIHSGSGLGLYIVYNEVNKLGGSIQLESSPGNGAAFIVSLPAGKRI
jgi:polar amino acid transport system substrate-binding protein